MTLEMYRQPKITTSIIPFGWYWWVVTKNYRAWLKGPKGVKIDSNDDSIYC